MKRIIFAATALSLALIISVFQLIYIGRNADEYLSQIQKIDTFVNNGEYYSALELCEKTENNWSDTAKKIDMLLIHDYVDGIGVSLAQMKTHIENGNRDMYFAESQNAKKGLASIKESEYPYSENLL